MLTYMTVPEFRLRSPETSYNYEPPLPSSSPCCSGSLCEIIGLLMYSYMREGMERGAAMQALTASASRRSFFSSPLLRRPWTSELPPMCFWAMKTLGITGCGATNKEEPVQQPTHHVHLGRCHGLEIPSSSGICLHKSYVLGSSENIIIYHLAIGFQLN